MINIKTLLFTITVTFLNSMTCFAAEENASPIFSSLNQVRRSFPIYRPITSSDLTEDIIHRFEIYYFLDQLKKIPEQERNQIGHLALQFMDPNMTKKEISFIIDALLRIPISDRLSVVNHINQLIIISLKIKYVKANLLIDLSFLPTQERIALIDQMNQWKRFDMSAQSIYSIISTLCKVPTQERTVLIDQLNQLIKPDMNGGSINSTFTTFFKVPKQDRATFIDQVNQLSTLNIHGHQISNVIESLSQVPLKNRIAFIEQVNQLTTPDMNGYQISNVIESLSQIPPEIRTHTFIEQVNQLIKPDMNGLLIFHLIKTLSRIQSEIRTPTFIDHLKQLIRIDMGASDASSIILSLSKFREQDRTHTFIEQVNQLTTPDMNGYNISDVISSLSQVPSENRIAFIEQVNQLIKPNMRGYQISNVIASLSRVPLKNRIAFIEQVNQLTTPQMNEYLISIVISSLSQVNPEIRTPKFIAQVQQLIHTMIPLTNVFQRPSPVIESLSQVPSQERSLRVARSLLFLKGHHNINISQLLEIPLNEGIVLGNMIAVAEGENPYLAGINAHAGNRDQQTIKAIKTLNENLPLSKCQLKESYADFLMAVKSLDSTKKERVLRSLGIDERGNVLPKPSREFFSGLISGVNESGTFTLSSKGQSINVSGQELMARLWHFANTYVEGEKSRGSILSSSSEQSTAQVERKNMRAGIMNALTKGINEHNTLRCEAGRVQLLALTTLQGRLRHASGDVVDIDEMGLNPSKSDHDRAFEALNRDAPMVVQAPENAIRAINNLDDIAHYMHYFINSLGHHIQTAEQFYNQLFRFRNALYSGDVMPRNERIDLNPSHMVYFVRMMEPVIKHGKIDGYRINPPKSLVAQLGFDEAFPIHDYIRQFGEKDHAEFDAAQEMKKRRALIEQQDREYAESAAADERRSQEHKAAATIQCFTRDYQKRSKETLRPTKEELRRIREDKFGKLENRI